ncbi:hypothetical protein Ciccas_010030 [Cichlidogyrus casuarinus]|uniref:Uncharacterized protein n=1 Tax=Cichlidogyrus casuarinus TaxID=1844966 RepID=A0ABD2PZV4_9PLAT
MVPIFSGELDLIDALWRMPGSILSQMQQSAFLSHSSVFLFLAEGLLILILKRTKKGSSRMANGGTEDEIDKIKLNFEYAKQLLSRGEQEDTGDTEIRECLTLYSLNVIGPEVKKYSIKKESESCIL